MQPRVKTIVTCPPIITYPFGVKFVGITMVLFRSRDMGELETMAIAVSDYERIDLPSCSQ